MDKYKPEELKQMAKTLIEARDSGDVKFLAFINVVAAMTGTNTTYVEQMVQAYATK